jgi:protein-disulfide isomerase
MFASAVTRGAAYIGLISVLGSFAIVPGFAQDNAADLRKEVRDLAAGQEQMKKELDEIKQLLLRGGARGGAAGVSLPTSMDAAGILVKGNPKAPITIVEFTDLQCPFCGRFAQQTLAEIDDQYIKTGKVRYVVKDFPLESIHSNALRAAQATHCAAEQDRAWEMHDRLFANQQKLTKEDLISDAAALALDTAKFSACLDSGRYIAEIHKEMATGQASGVNGTPTFFVGLSDTNPDQMKPQRMLNGAVDFAVFKSIIDGLSAKQAKAD